MQLYQDFIAMKQFFGQLIFFWHLPQIQNGKKLYMNYYQIKKLLIDLILLLKYFNSKKSDVSFNQKWENL